MERKEAFEVIGKILLELWEVINDPIVRDYEGMEVVLEENLLPILTKEKEPD